MQYLDTGLLILCLSAVVSNYVWTFSKFSELRDKMVKHETKEGVHVDANTFVKKEVCVKQVELIQQSIRFVQDGLIRLEKTFVNGVSELKAVIKNSHAKD